MIKCEVENIDGRKIYMKASIIDGQETILVEAKALF